VLNKIHSKKRGLIELFRRRGTGKLDVKVLIFASAVFAVAAQAPTVPKVMPVSADTEFVHDPSLIKEAETWYLFSTNAGPNHQGEIPVRCSKDLRVWKKCGSVRDHIPDWIVKESPLTRNLWAPDISFFNGEYHLYYAFSVFGKNTSGIALLTNRTLDRGSRYFDWKDSGLVLKSREEDNFNAIDPNLVLDEKGHAWLAFGSFWDGIKMRRLDDQIGKLSSSDTKLYSLARRKRPDNAPPNPPGLPGNWQAIEAPFIVYHGPYYYLFVSFDLCCRGTKSTYKIMVGRSREVTGPYTDESGTPMLEGGGTPVLVGNDRWLGPGGQSIRTDTEHGLGNDHDVIVFHAYDSKTGNPYLQISSIDWTGGWPHVALDGSNSANP
jgi:arabinan endo-1,5-alpha-L-arabinosidase